MRLMHLANDNISVRPQACVRGSDQAWKHAIRFLQRSQTFDRSVAHDEAARSQTRII